MSLFSLDQVCPQLSPDVFIAPGAVLIGKVRLALKVSVWFNSVLRGDNEEITIGEETNIQDLSMAHTDPGMPLKVGCRVTVGHRCILHGCIIEDDCLIGMGAILMNRARIGRGSIIGAGSVVLEGQQIPPFSLVVGSPGKVKKTFEEEILHDIRKNSWVYVERAGIFQKKMERIQNE